MDRISEAVQKTICETIEDESFCSEILDSILHPPSNYYLRFNLTKQPSQDIFDSISQEFNTFKHAIGVDLPGLEGCLEKDSVLPQAIKFPVFGSNTLKDEPIQIACDKFAAEAVMMGADLYIPGVKEISTSFKKGDPISIRLFLPQNHPFYELKGTTVANGVAAIDSNQFPKLLKGVIVQNSVPQHHVYPYRSSPLYEKGFFTDQTYGAMVAVACFMSKYEELRSKNRTQSLQIIDLCSAPGHKTSGMAEWGYWASNHVGDPQWPRILSIDRSSDRLQSLTTDISRLGLQNISIVAGKLEKIIPRYPEFQSLGDFIFFDPPCSALGTRPKLFLDKTQAELDDFPKNQRRLLKVADQFVKPGGFLMYNTCTIPKAENEGIVAYAVEKLGYKIVPLPSQYSQLGESGLSYETLSEDETKKLLRFYPRKTKGHGYFIALLQKNN